MEKQMTETKIVIDELSVSYVVDACNDIAVIQDDIDVIGEDVVDIKATLMELSVANSLMMVMIASLVTRTTEKPEKTYVRNGIVIHSKEA